jgi:acetoacetyl-CoA synthetase
MTNPANGSGERSPAFDSSSSESAKLLWAPADRYKEGSRITAYTRWLAETSDLHFPDYESLWQWSTTNIEAFWASAWHFFDIRARTPYRQVLSEHVMPGARWFDGAELNFVDQIFRHVESAEAAGRPAIVYASEAGFSPPDIKGSNPHPALERLSWGEMRRQVASFAAALRGMGVQPGDRVAAILPNIPETVIAFLAVASIGGIWSLCSSDMGRVAVADRFKQIAPRVVIAADGYVYAGKLFDRGDVVAEILNVLPSVETVVIVPRIAKTIDRQRFPQARDWRDLVAGDPPLQTEAVPADHPLWIVYSSGTTGLPKPIVHGHAGILVEMLVLQGLHSDLGAGDIVQWYTSSGWIMWNAQVGALATGATLALYDGSPAYPDLGILWRFIETAKVTNFGSGAAYYANCAKAGLEPAKIADLSSLRALSSTGSPLSPEAYEWIYASVRNDIWLSPISGGTDFAGAFVCGSPTLPVYAGEMQCRALGHKVEAFDDEGHSIVDEVGELVCTEPVPSMPLRFWNDEGDRRYRDSYFDVFPGVWRHGDWIKITPRGGAIIYGRSDATINRHGIRMGTSEFYRLVESLPEIADSLVVDLEFLGRESFLYLFVTLRNGMLLDDALRDKINGAIRTALSARHVPSAIVEAPAIPYTLSGKKLEVPVKKLLLGQPPEKVASRDSLASPESFDWFVAFAREHMHG